MATTVMFFVNVSLPANAQGGGVHTQASTKLRAAMNTSVRRNGGAPLFARQAMPKLRNSRRR